MDEELDKKLVQDFPLLYADRHGSAQETCMCWGFEVGDGWYQIIDSLCNQIQHRVDWKQEQKEKYSKLVQLYKYWNSKVNLISRKDIDNLEINHILHSLSIVKIVSFKDSTSVLDVGTGGGLPGIPLAIFFPKVNFTLIDSIGKKIKVVKSICNELSINNVDAINDRVENHLNHYDFILSRAVTRMDKFYKIVNKNFRFNSSNKMKNGII